MTLIQILTMALDGLEAKMATCAWLRLPIEDKRRDVMQYKQLSGELAAREQAGI